MTKNLMSRAAVATALGVFLIGTTSAFAGELRDGPGHVDGVAISDQANNEVGSTDLQQMQVAAADVDGETAGESTTEGPEGTNERREMNDGEGDSE